MRIRDKIITAVCRTVEGLEWSTVKVVSDGIEPIRQESISVAISEESSGLNIELPEEMIEQIKGDISVPLRTADLLMRVIELPAVQADELQNMAALQIDKISPFPADQIAFSHEVLQQSEDTSLVLLAIAKRSCIDHIGDAFKEKGIHIHSIDSRDLGWMRLLADAGHLAKDGCEIILINDGIEFSLIITRDGIPLAFRMLHVQVDAPQGVDKVVREMGYTLISLDAEYDLPSPSTIQYWSQESLSVALRTQLAEKSGLSVRPHSLDELPPLSEGIVRRALAGHSRIELIPQEWIEHETNQKLRKKTIIAGSAVVSIWLMILLAFFTIYKIRDRQLATVQERANDIAPKAKQALKNREKLKALKVYTNRSNSALECLREITLRLPIGDIEFLRYNYDKSKGVSLRGTSSSDSVVDDFFIALGKSPLFEEIKNQSSHPRTSKGVRRYEFSATLTLPLTKDQK